MGDFFSNAAQGISGMFGKGSSSVDPFNVPTGGTSEFPTGGGAPTGNGGYPGDPNTPIITSGNWQPPTEPLSYKPQFNPWSVLPAAVGGIGSIIGLARGQGSATDKALKAQAQSTKGLQNASNQAIQAYSSGTLTPAQQAARDREKAAMVAQVEQAMANSGTPQGTAHAQALAYVEQQLAAQDAAMWQQNFNSGLAGINLTQGNLASLAKQQAAQDAEQRKAWSDFMAALGKLGTDIGPIFT